MATYAASGVGVPTRRTNRSHGYGQARLPRSVYIRRRIVVGALALSSLLSLDWVGHTAYAMLTHTSVTTTSIAASLPRTHSAAVHTVVVKPQDTLWNIARAVAPTRPTQETIARIRELNGMSTLDVLRAGSEIRVP